MRVQKKYRKQILEQTSSKYFSAPKSLAQKYRKQTSPMFLGSKIKAGNFLHSQRQNHNKWIRERGSSTIIGVYSAYITFDVLCANWTGIMEGENTLLIDDATIFQMEEDQDHERNISDSSDEDGSDSNSNDSDGVTDAEQELQNTVTIKKKKKRGLTRLPKLRTAYTNYGGRKRRVKFDQLGRFTGKYKAEFPSFLGDLVREKVGISVFNWKDVKKEVRDKLWEEITTDASGKTKLARKESLYRHRMGQGGYSALREKLMEIEKQINDGELKLDPGTDAMTLVFGKENGGFLKGVGTGVTATRYFHVPRNKGSAKEQIQELKIELQKGKREIEKKR
ncbi:hypothetical protein OROMI_031398 [Orobanche minor]